MKRRNNITLAAGTISLFTTLLHLIGGQLTLVNPLNATNLEWSTKTEWLGAWHIVTFVLAATSFILLQSGLNQEKYTQDLIKFIAFLNLLFVFAFLLAILLNMTFAPQWILFLPVAILAYLGSKKMPSANNFRQYGR